MPRSFATIGADTTLTSCNMGRRKPAIAAEVSALVADLDFGDPTLGELACERAELLGERNERLEARRLLRGDGREIDGIGNRAAQQVVRHLLGDLQRDVFLSLRGGRAE